MAAPLAAGPAAALVALTALVEEKAGAPAAPVAETPTLEKPRSSFEGKAQPPRVMR